jgi:NAD(P)H-dependent FMN reductase
MRILAICGSLRRYSTNRALLLAVQKQAPEGTKVAIFESIRDLPHFDPDLDGADRDPEDRPDGVLRLRRELAASDALLISTPEYAHGLPGSLKNALDWLVSSPVVIGKPVALIYGSTGEANHAQEQLREILTTMSAVVVLDAIIAEAGFAGAKRIESARGLCLRERGVTPRSLNDSTGPESCESATGDASCGAVRDLR